MAQDEHPSRRRRDGQERGFQIRLGTVVHKGVSRASFACAEFRFLIPILELK